MWGVATGAGEAGLAFSEWEDGVGGGGGVWLPLIPPPAPAPQAEAQRRNRHQIVQRRFRLWRASHWFHQTRGLGPERSAGVSRARRLLLTSRHHTTPPAATTPPPLSCLPIPPDHPTTPAAPHLALHPLPPSLPTTPPLDAVQELTPHRAEFQYDAANDVELSFMEGGERREVGGGMWAEGSRERGGGLVEGGVREGKGRGQGWGNVVKGGARGGGGGGGRGGAERDATPRITPNPPSPPPPHPHHPTPDIMHGLRQADGWWTGCSQLNGLFGDFPANYVEPVDVTEVPTEESR